MAGSGWTPKPEKDLSSDSPSPSEREASEQRHILIVEDNPGDVFLIREALTTANITAEVHVVNDGEAAVLFFSRAGESEPPACPLIIILDLNLPKKDGQEVLRELKDSPCRHARVIVVTSSDAAEDRNAAAGLGVSRYFRKPSTYDGYMRLGEIVRNLLDPASADK